MKRLLKLFKTVLKLAIFTGLLVGGYYGYTLYFAPEEEDDLGELPTAVAEVRDITVSVSATGVLQPVKVVEVKSRASGEIMEMPVEMGDFMRRGDLIAQIDTRILEQEFKQAEADLQSATVRRDIAKKQYERAQSLYEQDLISEFDLENSQQNYTNAEGSLLRAQASLQLATERLEDATVTAPVSGTIIQKAVEEGMIITSSTSNVSGGTTLVRMADLSELEIRTLVDEIDIGSVQPGQTVESTVEAYPDREFRGTVMKIEPQSVVQQSVTTFPVLSRIDNSDGLLLPGMNADVNIIIHRRPGVLGVPNEAVRTTDDARDVVDLLGLDLGDGGEQLLADAGGRRAAGRGGPGAAGRGGASQRGGAAESGEGAAEAGEGNGPRAQGGQRAGSRRGGDLQNLDPELRRRFEEARERGDTAALQRLRQELQRQLEEEAEQEARDPWGMEGGRREPAVVFVRGEDGLLAPRQIVAGVRDWEYTEVISGLGEGEQIIVLPSTSLLRSQESLRERFSRRSSLSGIMGGGRGPRR